MKKIKRIALFSLLLTLVLTSVAMAGPGDDKPEMVATRVKTPPTLDGDLSDWENAVWYTIDQKTSYMEEGSWDGDADLSAQFAVCYDFDNMYIAVKVVDDEIYNAGAGGSLWTGDSVEVWLDWERTHALAGYNYYQVALAPSSSKYDENFEFLPDYYIFRNPTPAKLQDKMSMKSVLTENGYIIEAILPFDAMTAAEANKLVGFNVSIVDLDYDGVWTHITWSGTNHSNPVLFVDITWK
jgi:hypothetical protein